MKTLLAGFLSVSLHRPVLAQLPAHPDAPVIGDTLSRTFSPAVHPMGTGFYQRPGDPPTVVRATLDNMPVKIPDPTREYSVQNSERTTGSNRYLIPLPPALRLPGWLFPPPTTGKN